MRIIVLDAYSRMGLGVINALDESYELIGGAPGKNGSRWADRRLRSPRLSELFRYPHPNADPAGFQRHVLDACARHDPDAIFPASTATALAISRSKDELASSTGVRLVVDDYDRLRQIADKWLLHQLCARLEVPTPRTVLASDAASGASSVGYPCLVKPRLAEGSRGVRIVHSERELSDVLAGLSLVGARPENGDPYVVQELISGALENVGTCAVRGRPVSLLTQRKIFTRYEFGGTALVSRSSHVPVLMEYAKRLVAELEWSGPTFFEFIEGADGRYYLIDGNPRVWASIDLPVACGLNICQQAVDIFVREVEPEPLHDYRVGLTMRWLSPLAVGLCFRRPRRLSAVWRRLMFVLRPGLPSKMATNLRRGNIRHLFGMAVDASRS